LRLQLEVDGKKMHKIDVASSPAVLGRGPECDVMLPYSGISQRHARLERGSAGKWALADLGGKNGTTLNGRFVSEPAVVSPGDSVGMATVSLIVLEDTAEVLVPPESASTTIARSVEDL
jgi:adenylate cyclase